MKRSFLLLLVIGIYCEVVAQKTFQITEESTMTITGTSTVHDWTSKVNTITGNVLFDDSFIKKEKLKKGAVIDLVEITIPVLSIESPRGATMDDKTYNALKYQQFPNIQFKLTQSPISSLQDNSFNIQGTGMLTIAGFEKEITLTVKGQKLAEDKYNFSGSYQLNMKDFKIEPPSAMFGQIVTGEEVTILFNLVVLQK